MGISLENFVGGYWAFKGLKLIITYTNIAPVYFFPLREEHLTLSHTTTCYFYFCFLKALFLKAANSWSVPTKINFFIILTSKNHIGNVFFRQSSILESLTRFSV